MNNRLQQFLDLENLSPARLADILGVQRSGVSHILSGRNKPGFDFIQKLLIKFPSLSADWFLTGKGKPYKEMNNFVNTGGQNPVATLSGNGANFQEKDSSDQWKNGSKFHDEKSSGHWKNSEFSRGANFPGQTTPQVGSPYFQNADFNKNEIFPHIEGEPSEQKYSYQKNIRNTDNLYEDNNSKSIDSFNINYIKTDNIPNSINSTDSDYLSDNTKSENIIDLNQIDEMETEDSSSLTNGDFFNEMESAGRINEKSDFLESNGNNGQNDRYLPDYEINVPKNHNPYRRENQINGASKGNDGKKRSVKRVIVFYNDGSFDELYPLGVGK